MSRTRTAIRGFRSTLFSAPTSMFPSIKEIAAAVENRFVVEDWHNFGARLCADAARLAREPRSAPGSDRHRIRRAALSDVGFLSPELRRGVRGAQLSRTGRSSSPSAAFRRDSANCGRGYLERADFSSNRHPALYFCLSMIFSENRYPPRIKCGASFSGSCSSRLVSPTGRPGVTARTRSAEWFSIACLKLSG